MGQSSETTIAAQEDNMLTRKHLRSITTAAALLALPVGLNAQDPDVYITDDEPMTSNLELDARAGVGMSAADLTAYTQPGLAVGAGAGFWLSDNVALRIDGDFSALRGDDSGIASAETTPDMNIFHYTAGLEFDLLGRDAPNTPWSVRMSAGAGGSTLDTDDFLDVPVEEADLTETVANVNAGAEIGRDLTENVMLTVSGKAFYMFLDEDNFNNLADLRPAEGPIQDGLNIPVTLSLRWDIPNPGTVGN
jgi:hypothetical protein